MEWNIAADLRGEESPVTTVDLLRADGTAVTVQGRGAMIPFGGRPAVQVVLRDVTEEKRAEAALRESEAKYRRMVDDDITGNFVSTPDGRLLDCNPAFVRMFGFASVEEALAADIRDLYDAPDERPALLHRLGRKRRLENEERFRRCRDGTRIHVVENIIGDFDDDGNLVQIRGYMSDDTQRHRAEADLREREQTLQGIFRAAPVGIGMVSHRRITQANDQLCRMTGYTRDELVGRDARLFYPDEETYAHVGREKYAQIMADGIGAVETQWRTKDGATLDILLELVAGGSHPSPRGRGLQRPRYHEAAGERAGAGDVHGRPSAVERGAAAVRVRGEPRPAGAIAVDRQLLPAPRASVQGQLGEDADEFIGFIIEGGNRMQRLIEDLLRLSRVETTAKPLVPTDAGEVVADALRLVETPIREAGATVTVGPLPMVMADAAQLGQVFTNLVGNALKYRRSEVPLGVRISAERTGRFWRFAVEDNGIGIEAEYFDRIFVIFQRLHTREEYEGTGIGLAVVRKIVERHGGRVWVESTPGQGSTFFFTLPAA